MVVSLPDESTRWRCAGCGNLTRFDVTRTRRTREFWHFDLAGERRVEDTEVEAHMPRHAANDEPRAEGEEDDEVEAHLPRHAQPRHANPRHI